MWVMTAKKDKKGFLWAVCAALLIILLGLMLHFRASAEEEGKTDETPVDFVLVMDCSKTMGTSDPDGLVTSAAEMFVDMLPAENARLAIVVFGKDYSQTGENFDLSQIEDLTDEVSQKDAYGKNYVRVVQGLTNVTTQDAKTAAKAAIESSLNEEISGATYTPIGYALEVANYVLEQGGSADNSAGVILMTDGRLNGQSEADAYDSEQKKSASVDKAVERLRAHEWPIYCMELNLDDKNDTDEYFTYKRAYYQMRENIPESEDDHFEVENAADAQTFFAKIFTRFYDIEDADIDTLTLVDGQCSRELVLDDMIAETNITLTGTAEAFAELSSITITDNNGNETVYTTSQEEESRIVTFGDKYATIKLLTPSAGTWKITVQGTKDVEIGLYAVSIHEMDLELMAEGADTTQTVARGTTLTFSASFVYHDSPYTSSTVYQTYPAILQITSESGEAESYTMTGDEQGYSYTCTFSQNGTYTVKAYVNNEDFRTGIKESGEYVITVANIETTATETPISAVTVHPGGAAETIDCSQYFTNPDNDTITYRVDYDQASGITYSMDESGALTLTAGETAGEYQITVSATDPTMETPATQTFTMTVENQPMTWADGTSITGDDAKTSDTISEEFCYNAGSATGFLSRLAAIPSDTEASILWSEYFTDPDGTAPVVIVEAVESSDAIIVTSDDSGMQISATGKGEAEYLATVSDRSDSSVAATLTVTIRSMNAKAMIWKAIRVPVIILIVVLVLLIILLVVMLGGRKIYGVWDVSGSGYYESTRRLGSTRSGKKKKCRLDNLLDDLNIPNGFGAVELVAGNNLNKAVFITNLKGLDYIEYNGNDLSDSTKIKKLKISSHQSITLTKDGVTVTLERQ